MQRQALDMISDQDLFSAWKEGKLVGPNESEASFLRRISDDGDSCHEIFGFKLNWVQITFSNRSLLPWQGGFFEILENRRPHIQLRSHFKNRDTLFGIYKKKTLIDHELVHAIRIQFEEPQFEEILAYRTSGPFHRFLGPLVATYLESIFLAASLFLGGALFPFSVSLGALFFSPLLFFGVRRFIREGQFKKALHNMEQIGGEKAFQLMLSLTDREIKLFAKLSKEEILSYIKEENSLRKRQVLTVLNRPYDYS